MEIKEESFLESSSLVILNLRRNKLGALTKDDFTGLKNLAELDLAENEIDVIEEDSFGHFDNLNILDLASNNIRELPVNTFRHLIKNQKYFMRYLILINIICKFSSCIPSIDL